MLRSLVGSIFQKTFDKINKSFTAAEDEEI